jgi:hypothetical protein
LIFDADQRRVVRSCGYRLDVKHCGELDDRRKSELLVLDLKCSPCSWGFASYLLVCRAPLSHSGRVSVLCVFSSSGSLPLTFQSVRFDQGLNPGVGPACHHPSLFSAASVPVPFSAVNVGGSREVRLLCLLVTRNPAGKRAIFQAILIEPKLRASRRP